MFLRISMPHFPLPFITLPNKLHLPNFLILAFPILSWHLVFVFHFSLLKIWILLLDPGIHTVKIVCTLSLFYHSLLLFISSVSILLWKWIASKRSILFIHSVVYPRLAPRVSFLWITRHTLKHVRCRPIHIQFQCAIVVESQFTILRSNGRFHIWDIAAFKLSVQMCINLSKENKCVHSSNSILTISFNPQVNVMCHHWEGRQKLWDLMAFLWIFFIKFL